MVELIIMIISLIKGVQTTIILKTIQKFSWKKFLLKYIKEMSRNIPLFLIIQHCFIWNKKCIFIITLLFDHSVIYLNWNTLDHWPGLFWKSITVKDPPPTHLGFLYTEKKTKKNSLWSFIFGCIVHDASVSTLSWRLASEHTRVLTEEDLRESWNDAVCWNNVNILSDLLSVIKLGFSSLRHFCSCPVHIPVWLYNRNPFNLLHSFDMLMKWQSPAELGDICQVNTYMFHWNIKFIRKMKLQGKEGKGFSNTLKNHKNHVEDLTSISIWIWQTFPWEPSVRTSSRRWCLRFMMGPTGTVSAPEVPAPDHASSELFAWCRLIIWAARDTRLSEDVMVVRLLCSFFFIRSISTSLKSVLFCHFYLILQQHPTATSVLICDLHSRVS